MTPILRERDHQAKSKDAIKKKMMTKKNSPLKSMVNYWRHHSTENYIETSEQISLFCNVFKYIL
jgi:hypothetical protein